MAMTASFESVPGAGSARLAAFAAARRHSRLVHVLRLALPLVAAGGLAAAFVLSRYAVSDGVDLTDASLSVTPNSIIMDRPNLNGFDGEDRAYALTADRAIQPLNNPGEIRLERIEATVTSRGGTANRITAESGDYDHLKNTLALFGPIAMHSADGYVLNLEDAAIDFAAGTLATDNPVSVGYQGSTIEAARFRVTHGGKVLVFEGGVKTVVMPPRRDGAAAAGN